jgi:signal transduction histidine kinase
MECTRRSRLFDGATAIVLTAVVLAGAVGEANGKIKGRPILPHPGVAAYGLVVVAALVLAARRRAPVATLAVSLVAAAAYTMLGYVDGSVAVAPMVALYAVATTGTVRRTLLAGAVTVVVLDATAITFQPSALGTGGTTVFPFVAAAAVFAGVAVANRRAYVASVEERARLAEQTRDEESRRRVDAERLRIARELHDVVAHSIAMINVQSGVAAHVIDDRPDQAKEALVAIKGASKDALRELRGILDVLRSADDTDLTSPAPGLAEVEVLIAAANRAGLRASVVTTGSPCALSPVVDLAAYRIVQESLTNAVRYAGPATVSIALRYQPGQLVVEVTDDGPGPAAPAGAGGGHGILGMQERAVAVGGTVQAGARPEGGFSVRACLPVGAP